MNRVAFFVLALVAVAIGDGDDIEKMTEVAKKWETDVETIQKCLDTAETNIEEISTSEQKWVQMKPKGEIDEIDEQIKQFVTKYPSFSSFLACILEKKNLIKDSKLVLSEIRKSLKNDMDLKEVNEEDYIVITKCVNDINEDDNLTIEIKVLKVLVTCVPQKED